MVLLLESVMWSSAVWLRNFLGLTSFIHFRFVMGWFRELYDYSLIIHLEDFFRLSSPAAGSPSPVLSPSR